MTIHILIKEKQGNIKKFLLSENPITIGRSRSCDVPLEDNKISGKHCSFHIQGGKVIVRDLESTNGTTLNHSHIVQDFCYIGDVVLIGSIEITLDVKSMSSVEIAKNTKSSSATNGQENLDREVPIKNKSSHPGHLYAAHKTLTGIVGKIKNLITGNK